MLNLYNIKAVLFDFDETLCIHTKRPYSDGYLEDAALKFLKGEDVWIECIPSTDMIGFIKNM